MGRSPFFVPNAAGEKRVPAPMATLTEQEVVETVVAANRFKEHPSPENREALLRLLTDSNPVKAAKRLHLLRMQPEAVELLRLEGESGRPY